MQVMWPALLGAVYGVSEAALAVRKRSDGARTADRGSLPMLWIVIGVSMALAVVASARLPDWDAPLLVRLRPVGVALFAAGLALRWGSILWLGRYFTVDVAIADDHKVIDTGPYAWVRHPSYSGALLAFVGLAITWSNWVSAAVVIAPVTAAFLRRIAIEEAALHAALGERYGAYARRTARLVPFVY